MERDLHLIKHLMLWNVGKVGKDDTVGELRMLHKIPLTPEPEHSSSSEPLSVPSLRSQPTSVESGGLGL